MSDIPVVADAGPLIGLARVGLLDLLRQLYERVLVPVEVFEELRTADDRPGSRGLRAALEAGWLSVAPVETQGAESLSLALGPGEAAAILLAAQGPCRFLLLDERRGRAVAKGRGLRVVGTGGVLVAAKEKGLIDRVSDALEQLAAGGYRLSVELLARVLELAGEGDGGASRAGLQP